MNKNTPDDDDEQLVPKDSKCWNCKHGMVLQERDLQTFVQPGIVPGNSFDGEPDQPGFSQMSIDLKKVRSVCFWRSATNQQIVQPLIFNVVTECSRHESN